MGLPAKARVEPKVEPKIEPKVEPKLETTVEPTTARTTTLPRGKIDEIFVAERLTMPFLHKDADEAERSFHEQATRAVERVFVHDFDDPAVLMSLYEKVLGEESLSFIRDDWREPLERGVVRAETLQQAAAPLKALRQALSKATPIEGGVFSGIHHPQCRAAFAELKKLDATLLDLAVTVAPAPRLAINQLEGLCELSYEHELAGRTFPTPAGPPPLRQLVRKAYQRAYKGRTVSRVVIVDRGWVAQQDQGQRILQAVVGVKRQKAFPLDPCVMEEITLVQQEKRPGRYGPPVCCQIRSSVAIACDQIK